DEEVGKECGVVGVSCMESGVRRAQEWRAHERSLAVPEWIWCRRTQEVAVGGRPEAIRRQDFAGVGVNEIAPVLPHPHLIRTVLDEDNILRTSLEHVCGGVVDGVHFYLDEL